MSGMSFKDKEAEYAEYGVSDTADHEAFQNAMGQAAAERVANLKRSGAWTIEIRNPQGVDVGRVNFNFDAVTELNALHGVNGEKEIIELVLEAVRTVLTKMSKGEFHG